MKLAVSLAFLAACAVAQDTATVEGVVVNKVTGAGIGDATVRFMAAKTGRYETTTDETGAFRISGINPGDYSSFVEKHGYFLPDLLGLGGGNTQRFAAGGDPARLRFELNPPAVIRGRVVGADGNAVHAFVDVRQGRTVSTNDDGVFAFENLEPGRYTLLARPIGIKPVAKQAGRTEMVPTYYPSAVDPAQAESIIVRAGAELDGYEIRLQSVPVYRVRGAVLNPDGKPAAKAIVELHARIAGLSESGSSSRFFFLGGIFSRESFSIRTREVGLPETEEPFVTGDDGVFEFPSVPAGDWTIRVEGDPVGQGVSSLASAIFSLGRGDPDDLRIQLAAPFSLSGVAVLSDGSPPPPGVMVAVSLFSETGRSGSLRPPDGSNSIRITDVLPGAHEIRAEVLFGNYYPDSILLGSADVTTQRVVLSPASPPIKIILKPAGTIRGTIEDADAGTVVLFPQSVSGTAYSAQSVSGKTFALDGIPPGDYYAIALDRFDPRTMAEALRLRSLMPRAANVRIEAGSTASVQLKVNHVAD